MWVIPSFFAVCYRLNDKGLHDFEKRMIISKLLGGGGCSPLAPPGCYGPVRLIYLDDSITNAEIFGSEYRVYRKDRLGKAARHGGGVLIAVKNSIVATMREDLNCKSELLVIDVVTSDNSKLTIGVFYRPPNSKLESLEDLATYLTNIKSAGLIIIKLSVPVLVVPM